MAVEVKFKVGDLVTLKSGGPEMTVCKLHEDVITRKFDGTYQCQWFAGKKLDKGNFPEDSLEAVEDKK